MCAGRSRMGVGRQARWQKSSTGGHRFLQPLHPSNRGKKKNVGVLEAAVEGVHCIKSCMWRSCLFTTYCVGQNGKYTPSTSQKQQSKGAVSKKNTLVRLSRGLGFSLFSRNAVFSWRKDWQTNRARQTLVFGRRVLKNQ